MLINANRSTSITLTSNWIYVAKLGKVKYLDISRARQLFPMLRTHVYLNNASTSPCPTPVRSAMAEAMEKWTTDAHVYESWMDNLQETKALFSELIGAKKEEIAGITNTSTGLSIVANMLPYKKGSNVVINDMEFPANTYPWLNLKRRGVEVRVVKNVGGRIRLKDLEEAVDDHTAALSISHVEFSNGFRNDLKAISEIVHRHGATFVVDAIQSAGALEIDVRRQGVDFLATSFHKWLLGPEGTGFLYVREELIDEFDPWATGWLAVENPEDFDSMNLNFSKTAQKFETGTHNLLGYVGAKAALEIFHDIGMSDVERRILDLSGRLLEELEGLKVDIVTTKEERYRSGIVNFKVPEVDRVLEGLARRNIVVSKRTGGIRVSPHFFNVEDELQQLCRAVKELSE
ncbi:MAG TPA: aminotransferase class V-fold PLP-dependent enzyme [Candidatus Bathyarchaeia archaeon]|nr:MAG: hypothetical protein A3K70_02055 [Candidatus Bathyarchaeota archaeon RBG_16_48_13]HJX23975.1 aminotransferase class V-fold PLP-dependent enzyme [Candidatus Bathyarchaeia archaeon]